MTSILQELHEAHKARALRLGIIQPQKPVVLPEVMVSAKSADLRRKADRDRVRRMQERAKDAARRNEIRANATKRRIERAERQRPSMERDAGLRTTDGRPTMAAIVAQECLKAGGVTPTDVRGKSQMKDVCKVRSAACYRIAVVHPEYTWGDIAKFMNRHHATVMHQVDVYLAAHPEAPKPERWNPRV